MHGREPAHLIRRRDRLSRRGHSKRKAEQSLLQRPFLIVHASCGCHLEGPRVRLAIDAPAAETRARRPPDCLTVFWDSQKTTCAAAPRVASCRRYGRAQCFCSYFKGAVLPGLTVRCGQL